MPLWKRSNCAGGSVHTELSISLDLAAKARRSATCVLRLAALVLS